MNKLKLLGAYLTIIGSHIYMIFVPLTMDGMLPHAIANLISIGIIAYNYGEHKRWF